MGMTNVQCAISGIPLGDRDEIMYIPLLKSPQGLDMDGEIYGISFRPEYDIWSVPVPGTYNMYANGDLYPSIERTILNYQLSRHMEPVDSKFDWEKVNKDSDLDKILSAIYYGKVKVRSFKEEEDRQYQDMLDVANIGEEGRKVLGLSEGETLFREREYPEPRLLRYALVLRPVWDVLVQVAKDNQGVIDEGTEMPEHKPDMCNVARIGSHIDIVNAMADAKVLGDRGEFIQRTWDAQMVFEFLSCANQEIRPSKIIGQGTPYWFAKEFANVVAERAEIAYDNAMAKAMRTANDAEEISKDDALQVVLESTEELTKADREALMKALRRSGAAD